MSSRFQRLQFISLGFSLLLVVAWVILVYQVSPLRDPSFQPNSANAGTLIPWLSGVGEDDWILSAQLLAFSLSTNIAFIFAQQIRYRGSHWLIRFIATTGVWLITFLTSCFMFAVYLLDQWLVD
ncbi:MAG: hypothetical protein WBA41_12300 [Rivularia sp. (in: cyanobacteria)]